MPSRMEEVEYEKDIVEDFDRQHPDVSHETLGGIPKHLKSTYFSTLPTDTISKGWSSGVQIRGVKRESDEMEDSGIKKH